MSATALPAMLDALATALANRGGMAGVNVFTAPVEPADLGKESVTFAAEVDIDQELAAMGSSDIEETFDVPGSIICFAPMATSTGPAATINAAAKTVRDRACDILEEVSEELASNSTVTGTVRDAAISSIKLTQGLAPEGQLGRWCSIEFTVTAEAHTTP